MIADEDTFFPFNFFPGFRKTSCVWLILHHILHDPNPRHYHRSNRVSPGPVWTTECPEHRVWREQRRWLPVVIALPESHQVIACRMWKLILGLKKYTKVIILWVWGFQPYYKTLQFIVSLYSLYHSQWQRLSFLVATAPTLAPHDVASTRWQYYYSMIFWLYICTVGESGSGC